LLRVPEPRDTRIQRDQNPERPEPRETVTTECTSTRHQGLRGEDNEEGKEAGAFIVTESRKKWTRTKGEETRGDKEGNKEEDPTGPEPGNTRNNRTTTNSLSLSLSPPLSLSLSLLTTSESLGRTQ